MEIDIAFDCSLVRIPLGMRRRSAHSNTHTVSNTDRDQHTCANGNGDTYTYCDRYTCANSDGDTYTNRHATSVANRGEYAHSYRNEHPHHKPKPHTYLVTFRWEPHAFAYSHVYHDRRTEFNLAI